MQKILSINVSVEPAEAVLVAVSDRSIEVLEQHTAELGDLLQQWEQTDLAADGTLDTASEENAPDTSDVSSSGSATLTRLLNAFSDTWSSSILIVPSKNYLSLKVSLPFADSKSIEKVIDLEVQDMVPFDVEEFLIGYNVLGVNAESPALFDVHVSLIPKNYIKRVLRTCRSCQFEPVAITSPASALASFYHVAPDYFADNAAFVYLNNQTCYSCSAFDGIVSEDRAFQNSWVVPNGNGAGVVDAQIKELKVALASLENRHNKNVEKVYFLGNSLNPTTLQNHLGRSVEVLDTSDLTKGSRSAATSIAAAAAVFVRDLNPAPLLSNFRSREFAFRPQLKQVFQGLKALLPYAVLTLLLVLTTCVVKIALNQYQIRTMRATIEEKIRAVAPSAANDGARTVKALNAAAKKVETELNSLGAPSLHAPIEVFTQLARDVGKAKAIEISQIRITGDRALITGTANSYAEADELRRIFKRNSDMYCVVERDNASSADGSRGFKYSINLCS